MGIRSKSRGSKNPPIFSHEFVIQNHEDIVSCFTMVFIVGLMFQVSLPIASKFVFLQHNVTLPESGEEAGHSHSTAELMYTHGRFDLCLLFFYSLVCLLVHGIVQEFVIDKLNKKLYLSKTKHSKFIESGQLLVFYLVSVLWGGHIIFKENMLLNIGSLWSGDLVSHALMPFTLKMYFVIQIAYWIHTFPELYLQKVKREEWMARIQYATMYLLFILGAYLISLTRLALIMLVVHYTAELLVHSARMMHYADKNRMASDVFRLYNGAFIVARLLCVIGTVLALACEAGLLKNAASQQQQQQQQQEEDNTTSTPSVHTLHVFSKQPVRMGFLCSVLVLQAWLMWNFINYHLRRLNDLAHARRSAKKLSPAMRKDKKTAKDKKSS